LSSGERARLEIERAAARTAEIEQRLGEVDAAMIDAGLSPDLDRRDVVADAARRLGALAESLSHER
jgi:hypothetical protein